MSSKLNSGVHYAYMCGGAAWECLQVKTDEEWCKYCVIHVWAR